MPAFYNNPASVDDIVGHTVMRILDQLGVDSPGAKRWNGMQQHDSAHLSVVKA
jgi:flavin prenyltransferase